MTAGLPNAISTTFGTRLCKLRKKRGWSQQVLAERIGFTSRTGYQVVCHWERGRRVPDLLQILSLLAALAVQPNTLLKP